MKNLLKAFFAIFLLVTISCNQQSAKGRQNDYVNNTPAYEQFHTIFKGEPSAEDIGRLMDAILDMYHYPKMEQTKQKFGSMFYGLRKNSVAGVSEMELMKYMYQNPNNIDPPTTAAAKALIILDNTK
ncbi:MAG: hypothetical protein JWR38_4450 [Mucilaginibacter sp.]|nr:hypothetical protein [Mucilaginibacter sp.]